MGRGEASLKTDKSPFPKSPLGRQHLCHSHLFNSTYLKLPVSEIFVLRKFSKNLKVCLEGRYEVFALVLKRTKV